MNVVKFVGAWFCIIGAVVVMLLLRDYAALPLALGVLSVAFSQAPANA